MANISIVGSGLVGSILACYLGRRGYDVNLYEAREDIRKSKEFKGRSVNLAISVRGLKALEKLGLKDEIQKYCVPMYARMIHNVNGTLKSIPYGKEGQCINSINRNFLNKLLLNVAENFENVKLNFDHKLEKMNLENNELKFTIPNSNELIKKTDVIFGSDGAFSKVRSFMMRKNKFNFNQKYIKHGYIELSINPKKVINSNGEASFDFALAPNYLHIWPRGEFMMIALPNIDKSFTLTLFMPFENFESINDKKDLLKFFETYFKDSIDLIGEKELIETFFKIKPSALITIKCSPYNYEGKCLLIGDSAHAMVPFYGQGMNCGFEDCNVLDDIIEEYSLKGKIKDFSLVFEEYNKARNENCKVICDLALYNYIEMRHLVNTWSFILRKKFDNILNFVLGDKWIPLYSMVTFSQIPYKKCLENKIEQDNLIDKIILIIQILLIVLTFYFFYKLF